MSEKQVATDNSPFFNLQLFRCTTGMKPQHQMKRTQIQWQEQPSFVPMGRIKIPATKRNCLVVVIRNSLQWDREASIFWLLQAWEFDLFLWFDYQIQVISRHLDKGLNKQVCAVQRSLADTTTIVCIGFRLIWWHKSLSHSNLGNLGGGQSSCLDLI